MWSDAADLIASGPLAKASSKSSIALIPIGKLPSDQLQAFSAELNRALKDRELLVSTDLIKTSKCATQLLVTSPGVVTRTQLLQLRQKLALQGSPIAGWVLLDPELDLGEKQKSHIKQSAKSSTCRFSANNYWRSRIDAE